MFSQNLCYILCSRKLSWTLALLETKEVCCASQCITQSLWFLSTSYNINYMNSSKRMMHFSPSSIYDLQKKMWPRSLSLPLDMQQSPGLYLELSLKHFYLPGKRSGMRKIKFSPAFNPPLPWEISAFSEDTPDHSEQPICNIRKPSCSGLVLWGSPLTQQQWN